MDQAARALGPARPLRHTAPVGGRARIGAGAHAVAAVCASGDTALVRRGVGGDGRLAAATASADGTVGVAWLRLCGPAWRAGRAVDQPRRPCNRLHAAT